MPTPATQPSHNICVRGFSYPRANNSIRAASVIMNPSRRYKKNAFIAPQKVFAVLLAISFFLYPALTHASNMVLTSNWATYGKDSYWVLNNVWGHGSLVNGIDYTGNLRPLLLRKT